MRIDVDLGERRYDVEIADGARASLAALIARRIPRAKSAVLVTSASLLERSWFDVDTGLAQSTVLVPEGEGAKTLETFGSLLEEFAARGLSRDDVVVGVGGGAITDVAGFAAASYLRGLALVQVPTTLVGQVDAAIGGKTGVNLRAGKNLAGAFYQPRGVLCDTTVLATLPERERRSGLGEVAKCWLLEGRDETALPETSLTSLIELSVRLKIRVVVADELEGDQRALLNYGHTLAHALEAWALTRGEERWRHGEAVAIGLAFAVRLARELDRVDDAVVATHDRVLAALALDATLAPDVDPDELLTYMGRDKKARHDLSFVLPSATGFNLVSGVDPTVVRDVLVRYQGEA